MPVVVDDDDASPFSDIKGSVEALLEPSLLPGLISMAAILLLAVLGIWCDCMVVGGVLLVVFS